MAPTRAALPALAATYLLAACSGGDTSPTVDQPATVEPTTVISTPEAAPTTSETTPAPATPEAASPEEASAEGETIAAPSASTIAEMTSAHVGETGWAYLDRALPITARRETPTRAIASRVCGLELAMIDPARFSRCPQAAIGPLLDCMLVESRAADERAFEAGHPPGSEARDQARLFVRDAEHEVELRAYPVHAIDCVDGVAIVTMGPYDFSSHHEIAVFELRDGRIATARQLMIDDPLEASSDCMSAWDGIPFLPIIRDGALAGSLVVNDRWSPRFGLGVGEIGQSGVIAGREPVVAYRERAGVLEGVPFDRTLPAECPIVVADGDGETNVRPLPNTGRAPVGTLPNGTQIDPVEQRGRWYRIETPLRGWVFSQSLDRRCPSQPDSNDDRRGEALIEQLTHEGAP